MKFIAFLLVFCGVFGLARAQNDIPATPVHLGKNDTIKTLMTKVDGELVPWVVLPEIRIVDTRIFASAQDRANYYRLRYNIIKVLPYAKFAAARYTQLQRDLALTADKKKQKELIKACEKDVKELFNKDIKNLTMTQGDVLIKLISRETGTTSYALAKELKGGFNAFLFQSVGKLFGHDLKQNYDRDEQRDIESILFSLGYTSSANL
ncbi:DUF4294 domain-containing protein [Mucilaginibacter pallidiroseus]|uniref:DUF4294 domain-containing protein n=1 Tax=Mucilaginibacter pallidiroseus TaxID=2599295 RepID=A0A563U7Y7_9SPHI|nr:DUF4294 domain-containing protein [Mucilaginibacter pallidiroseus]TWR27467.1 DUF4294 domain-containing protein [Mucilaginibacter pallidiroseus]